MQAGPDTRQTGRRFNLEAQSRTCPLVGVIGVMWVGGGDGEKEK